MCHVVPSDLIYFLDLLIDCIVSLVKYRIQLHGVKYTSDKEEARLEIQFPYEVSFSKYI